MLGLEIGNDYRNNGRDIAASYLRGNAAEWYETDRETSHNGIQTHRMNNFRERFKDYFSPQSKQIQWQEELTNIKRGIGENIEDYSRRFKKIMRKVKHLNLLADGVQVNYFIKGLNPLYIIQIMMTAPANLNVAVTQIKLLETGMQIAGSSVTENTGQTVHEKEKEDVQKNKDTFNWNKDNFRNRNTFENSRRNNFGNDFRNRNNDTDVDELTKQLEKMKIQMANLIKNNGRNNYDGSWRIMITSLKII